MKRTILSAAAICAIAVGFVLPSTSFAATQRAHGQGDQPNWQQSNVGQNDQGDGNNGISILDGLSIDRNCSLINIIQGSNHCHMDQNNGPWTGDHYQYDPGK